MERTFTKKRTPTAVITIELVGYSRLRTEVQMDREVTRGTNWPHDCKTPGNWNLIQVITVERERSSADPYGLRMLKGGSIEVQNV